jgi:hypothetical protein
VALPIDHGRDCCRLCGCTEERPCPGVFPWVVPPTPHEGRRGICPACHGRVVALVATPKAEFAAFRRALRAEVNPNVLALAVENATGDWRRSWLRRRLADTMAAIRRAGWTVHPETRGRGDAGTRGQEEDRVTGLTRRGERLLDPERHGRDEEAVARRLEAGQAADPTSATIAEEMLATAEARRCRCLPAESEEIGPVGLPTVEAVIEVQRCVRPLYDGASFAAVVSDRVTGTVLHRTSLMRTEAGAFRNARRWVKANQTPQRGKERPF